MELGVFSILFPALLAVVMFSLGLGLTPADFAHVLAVPRAVLITLLCQVVLLPALCFGLVVGFGLGPNLAVGMMVLAASPGGAMAGVLSHLAGGDVALNVTVTAINSVLAVFTLPVVLALAVGHFLGGDAAVGLQAGEVVRIGLVVLVPVAIGMTVRRRLPAFTDRVQKPLRTTTIIGVFVAIVASILPQGEGFLWGLAAVGLLCLLFSTLSLTIGYLVPRLARIGHRQAVAAAMEMGIHNAVLAITVTISVLDNPIAAVAPAMYGALMYLPAAAFAWLVGRRARQARPPTATGPLVLVRGLAWDVGLPLVTYYGLHLFGAADRPALLAATAVAGARIVWVAVRDRKLNLFATVMLVVFGLGLALAFVSGDARFLLLRGSFVTAAVGLTFLATAVFGRPLTLAAMQSFQPSRAAGIAAAYDAEPGFRRGYRTSSLVWGGGLLLEALVRVPLVYLLPIPVMVGLSEALMIATFAGLIAWNLWYVRRSPARTQ